VVDVELAEISNRVTFEPALSHKSKEFPEDENTNAGSLGSVVVPLSLADGFRRIELAILELRLDSFGFVLLSAVQVNAPDGKSSLALLASNGAELVISSGRKSTDEDGVCTGIGRFIDSLELTDIGI
jgi:hypothetical protein